MTPSGSNRILAFAFLLALATAFTHHLHAQEDASATLRPAAPKTVIRTARLSFYSGDLKVQRSDNTGEDTAALNMPLTAGTRLVTGDSATAEVEFEDGSVARLAPHSALSIDTLSLDAQNIAHTELTLLNGLGYFELRHTEASTYLVDAAGVDVSPAENAVLRITLNDPPPVFSVFSGSITTGSDEGFSATVKAGESLRPDPDAATQYLLNQQLASDTWDAWNQARDQAAADQSASRTAAREGYAGAQGDGWSDLDANGTWYSTTNPDGSHGEIWQPAAAAGDDSGDDFDPYGDGAFVWSGGGYYWASAYTWGWLPYRCGRWIWYPGFGWAWKPNHFCGTWGFQAGGIFIDRHPEHYKVIHVPFLRPEPIHPILRVHNPVPPKGEPRPVSTGTSETKLAGNLEAIPLPLVGPPAQVGGSGTMVGSALYRDYPVEATSRQPVLGTIAKVPEEPSAFAPVVTGRIAHQPPPEPHSTAAPVRVHASETVSVPRPASPPPPSHSSPPPAPASTPK
jgi:hypothetical protein